jgi:hypothetical protein
MGNNGTMVPITAGAATFKKSLAAGVSLALVAGPLFML